MNELPIPETVELNWEQIYSIPIAPEDEELVDTAGLHPRILVYPEYYKNGIAHAVPLCLLRRTVAQRLVRAAELLPEGVYLLVLDCWRPIAVQAELQRIIGCDLARKRGLSGKDLERELANYVARPSADPARPSPHLSGGSVDLTLCNAEGTRLDMGGDFDAPDDISSTRALEGVDCIARRNRRLLYHVMLNSGFTNLPTEWWHFDYGNQCWAFFSGESRALYSLAPEPSPLFFSSDRA